MAILIADMTATPHCGEIRTASILQQQLSELRRPWPSAAWFRSSCWHAGHDDCRQSPAFLWLLISSCRTRAVASASAFAGNGHDVLVMILAPTSAASQQLLVPSTHRIDSYQPVPQPREREPVHVLDRAP